MIRADNANRSAMWAELRTGPRVGNSAYAGVTFASMNLHERLEAAKAERRQRAGLPPEAPEVSPMDQPFGGEADDDEAAIDLTGYAPIVDLRPSSGRARRPELHRCARRR